MNQSRETMANSWMRTEDRTNDDDETGGRTDGQTTTMATAGHDGTDGQSTDRAQKE